MSQVNTKRVEGRRDVSYERYDDLLADIRRLAGVEHRTIGNWSLAQITAHLAKGFAVQVDGAPFKVPWLMGVFMRTFMKKRLLTKPLPSGFKIPERNRKDFVPEESVDLQTAVSQLEVEIERCSTSPNLKPHPVLGKLTREEWEQFNLRHAEMHMSFVVDE